METSAVAAAVRVITKEPDQGTTFLIVAVVSLVLTVTYTRLDVVQVLFVTVTVVQPAAMLTVPDGLFIV